jgi:RNA polymerase sigma-70 factor, ECF subfamily
MAQEPEFNGRVRDCTGRLLIAGVDALGALFDLTAPRLVRFAVAIVRNQHDAEDCVQSALLRVARNPRLLAAAACPWSYLLRMVRNEAILIGRRRRIRNVLSNLTDLVTVRQVDEAEQEETIRDVWRALRSLPTEQAEVVVLKIWEELTFAQIAQILELSPNTVASRYQYGLGKLSKRLSHVYREAGCD